MPFVRHELGGRLRLRRIPALHVSLDESAERGTRVMQILGELEAGHDAAGEALADAPLAETLPTPVTRLPREGDADEPEPAGPATTPRPRRRTRPDRSGDHPAHHRRGRHSRHPQDPT